MLDNLGRRLKDALLDPILLILPAWVTPNGVTLASLLPGVAAAILAGLGLWYWAILAFALNRLLDGLDGLLARGRGLQSDLGGYMDIMIDFLVYAALPIGVWIGVENPILHASGDGVSPQFSGTLSGALPLVVLLAIFYVNAASWMYLSAVLEKRRKAAPSEASSTTVVMPSGLVEGTETVLFYSLFLLLPDYYPLLFYLMAGATTVGIVQRLRWAHRQLR